MVLLLSVALAGSLDLLEVGGLWSTPTDSGPGAVWWNPGAMSAGKGTRFLVEGALVYGGLNFERRGPPNEPSWLGAERYRLVAPLPFAGVVTDAGVPGLGIGAAVFAPHARGARSNLDPGPGRTYLREGMIDALHASLAVSYGKGPIRFGAAATVVSGAWRARIDYETTSLTADAITDTIGGRPESHYDGSTFESSDYLAAVNFGPLRGLAASFQAGVLIEPAPRWRIGISYAHGSALDHRGPVVMDTPCPSSDDDALGFIAASSRGLCNTRVNADASIAYRYPSRANLGLRYQASPSTQVEALAGAVAWSQFDDFRIRITDPRPDEGSFDDDTTERLTLDRRWARANVDSYWVGAQVNQQVGSRLELRGRLLFDRRAVPDHAMSPNNSDADSLHVGLLAAVRPTRKHDVAIALAYTGVFSAPRVITNSAFGLAVPVAERNADRWNWAAMNGRYATFLHRFALSLRGAFDAPRRKGADPQVQ